MAQRRKPAHVDVGSFFHDLFHRSLITRDKDRSLPRLDPLIAGQAGFLHFAPIARAKRKRLAIRKVVSGIVARLPSTMTL